MIVMPKMSWEKIGLVFLILIWVWVTVANFVPGTSLLGWDVTDASFNPLLLIYRTFFETWQSFQGVGVMGGHGYNAILPHALLNLVLSLFLPHHLIRYAFSSLAHLSGAVGTFFLTLHLLKSWKKSHSLILAASGVLASATYLLHYGTVQTFYVQLEAFILMYALFPWSLLSLFRLLKSPNPKKWLLFLLVNFAISGVGFVPPIFVSYAIFISIALACYWLGNHTWKSVLFVLKIITTLVVVNLYWIVPVLLFTASQSNVYLNSRLNQITTQDYVLTNRWYGEPANVALLKSFYSDSLDQNRFGGKEPLSLILKPWLEHFRNNNVLFIGYSVFVLAVIGWCIMLFRLIMTQEATWSIGLMSLSCFVILATGTPILSEVGKLLGSVPFLQQAFRIPFSKLSMSASLYISLGLGVSFFALFLLIEKLLKNYQQALHFTVGSILLTSFIAIMYLSWPSFHGYFLYPGLRVSLPESYKELSKYMLEQNTNSKVAVLPILTYTGWDMHQWKGVPGFTGSGFLWYMIPQAIFHRSFDVWSTYNENYRGELMTAVYRQDSAQLQSIFSKYGIKYVLVDTSIVVPTLPSSSTDSQKIINLLDSISGVTKVKKFGDNLSLYQISDVEQNLVTAPIKISRVSSKISNNARFDQTFTQLGDYTSGNEVYYPFGFMSDESPENIEVLNESLRLRHTQEVNLDQKWSIITPKFHKDDAISFNVYYKKNIDDASILLEPIMPEIVVNKEMILSYPPSSTILPKGNFSSILINKVIYSLPQDLPPQELRYLGSLITKYQEPITLSAQDISGQKVSEWQDKVEDEYWKIFDEKKVTLENSDKLSFEAVLPLQGITLNLNNAGFKTAMRCTGNSEGKIEMTKENESLQYSASDRGAICDFFNFKNISWRPGNLVYLQGSNKNGRTGKITIINQSLSHNEVEYQLPNGAYQKFFSLMPTTQFDEDIGIYFENRSFGRELSQNVLERVKVLTFPVKFLTNLRLESNKPATANELNVSNVWQFGSGVFAAKISNPNDKSQILKLEYGYNPYWIAFSLEKPLQIFEHSQLNSWANAWQIPPGDNLVILLFWPQLIVWISYILLLLILIIFITKFYKSRPEKKKKLTTIDMFRAMKKAADHPIAK